MKAMIAMSGGVDSSVAALVLKQKDFEEIGCTMKLFESNDYDSANGRTCCSIDDVEDARSVAFRLGIPYYVFNYKDKFKENVIDKFIESYENGRTPNPCIDCNRYLKFSKLYERAKILGCDYIATGHYARIEKSGDRFILKKALDSSKDQSYVLYFLTQEQLGHTLFPLGNMQKTEVRAIAESNGFINADKPDSQDICFVPNGDYAKVIEQYSKKQYPKGNFISADGRVLGTHNGIIRYTIGQRKGLGISAEKPLYVCRLCPEDNTVILGDNDDLFYNTVYVNEFNWISGEAPTESIRCRAKIRYRQPEQSATVYPQADGVVKIVFDVPQRAITPGQSAVLYDGDIVLGGGTMISFDNT